MCEYWSGEYSIPYAKLFIDLIPKSTTQVHHVEIIYTMKKINSIIIVGSSGSGKTTLVNGLRTKKYADKVVVPRRYITRPQRQGDDLIENIHITKEEFEQKLKAGEIDPAWTRELENGRLEQYGFVPIEPGDNRLRIYSGNNAFLRDINSSVQKILNKNW